MNQDKPTRLTITSREAATILGIGLNSMWRLVNSGRIGSIRVGRRVLIPLTELEAFLEREMVQS